MLRRTRFGELIGRQLDLFVEDHADLLGEVDVLRRRWTEAARDEAEERYGDYQDAVETGTELLADLRDHYAASLADADAERYRGEFNRAVARRLRVFALELENR